MSIYIYAILLSPANNLDLPKGIKNLVELVVCEDIVAVIERGISSKDLQEPEDILLSSVISHDRVIQKIFSQISLIPLRFGTIFISISSLLNNLKNNQIQYLQELNKINDKVEHTMKFLPIVFESNNLKDENTKGKNYLLAKKKSYQLQQNFKLEQEKQWQVIKNAIYQKLLNKVVIEETEEIKKIFLLTNKNTNINNLITFEQELSQYWEIIISQPLPCYHFTSIQTVDHS